MDVRDAWNEENSTKYYEEWQRTDMKLSLAEYLDKKYKERNDG